MPLRSAGMEELQCHNRKETAAAVASADTKKLSTRHLGGSAPAASQDAPPQQIIECRKKNSKGESVITHRYRKGRLLGKVGSIL